MPPRSTSEGISEPRRGSRTASSRRAPLRRPVVGIVGFGVHWEAPLRRLGDVSPSAFGCLIFSLFP